VSALAGYVYSQHRSLRLLSALVERMHRSPVPSVITLLGALRAFLMVRRPAYPEGAIWIARLANERRELEAIPELVPGLRWSEVKLNWRIGARDVLGLAATLVATIGGMMRISRRMHDRYPGFRVLRVIELLGYYFAYVRIFRRGGYVLAMMSSHSNPHAIAFNVAARRFGVPVVLITHGMPVRPVARMRFDLGVVHCADAQRTYAEEGCRISHVLTHGRREEFAPMPAGPSCGPASVGIFLCKDVDEEGLRSLVRGLLASPWVGAIRVRAHPFNLWRGLGPWIASLDDARVRLGAGGTIEADLVGTAVVLAGNSSVHLDAVVAGRPSAYVRGLDHGGSDLHRFVARGLVYEVDAGGSLDPEAMLAFYRRPGWLDVLRDFANIDEDRATVAARAAEAIQRLASRARRTTAKEEREAVRRNMKNADSDHSSL
jgi:hypothetical protein